MIPLYGFLEGDVLGLLILASETDTMDELVQKVVHSARLRVLANAELLGVVVLGKSVPSKFTVQQAGLAALDRFDVRREP